MNKSQLIEALAKAENLALKKAEEVVNTVFGDMEKAQFQDQELRGVPGEKSQDRRNHQCRLQETPVLQGRKRAQGESRYLITVLTSLVVLDGELAVPYNPRSAYAGSKVLSENPSSALTRRLRTPSGPEGSSGK